MSTPSKLPESVWPESQRPRSVRAFPTTSTYQSISPPRGLLPTHSPPTRSTCRTTFDLLLPDDQPPSTLPPPRWARRPPPRLAAPFNLSSRTSESLQSMYYDYRLYWAMRPRFTPFVGTSSHTLIDETRRARKLPP